MSTLSRTAEYKRMLSKYVQKCSTRCMVVVNISRLLHVTSACTHPERTTLPKSVQKYIWYHGCARYTGSLFNIAVVTCARLTICYISKAIVRFPTDISTMWQAGCLEWWKQRVRCNSMCVCVYVCVWGK